MSHNTKCYTTATDDRYDFCDHVKLGDKCWLLAEVDSFGPVGGVYCCQDCKDKIEAEEQEEEAYCFDCNKYHKKKNGSEWRWYDFDPKQGDESMFICDNCWDLEKHQNRMAKDQKEYENERAYYG